MTKSISVILSAVTGPYQAAMARASTATAGFSATAKGAGTQVGKVAESTGLVNKKLLGAAGAVLAVKKVASAAIDWESAFAGVRKTVDGTEAELGGLAKGLRDMSTEIPVAATELASVAEAAGQLGIETGNIEKFTEVMAQLGATTNLSSTEAATQLSRFANITGMSQDDFDRLGSVLVELGNNAATTEAEIVDMALRIAGAGEQIGFSEGQILAWSTALSSAGIRAEAGGSAISKVMIDIANEVETSGDKLELFADTAGMSADQFAQAFRDDASGAMVSFVDGLGRMEEQGGSTLGRLEELEISEVRMRDALLRLSTNTGLVTDALGLQGEAWADGTAAQEEFAKRLETTDSQIQIAKNALTDLKVEIGQGLLPVLGEAATALTDLLTMELPGGGGQTVTDLLAGAVQSGLDPVGAFERAMGDNIEARREGLNESLAGLTTDAGAALDDFAASTGNLLPDGLPVHDAIEGFMTSGAGSAWLDVLAGGADASDDVAAAQENLGVWVKTANDEIVHQNQLFREQFADPVTNLIGAIEERTQAQKDYADAVAEYGVNSQEAEDAALRLFDATLDAEFAADTAAGKFGEVSRRLDEMEASGHLSAEQVDVLKRAIREAREEGEQFQGDYVARIDVVMDDGGIRDQIERLKELAAEGQSAIDFLLGRGGSTSTTTTSTFDPNLVEGRAGGGTAFTGRPYMVGEEGPELFVPGQTGTVIPAPETAAMRSSSSIGSQTNVHQGAIQMTVRDEAAAMRAGNRELHLMSLGYR